MTGSRTALAARAALSATALAAAVSVVAAPASTAGTAPSGPDPADFTTRIDNPYLPLVPGTVFRYRESGDGGSGRVVIKVTHRTRTVQGVQTVVVRDKAYSGGALVEDTFDWYAQDRRGTVWYFGESTREFENGKVVSTAGSWEAGVDGARAGIAMKARPRVGATYYQEYSPGVAVDQATVLRRDATARSPYGTFTGALKTRDFTALDRDVVEHKYYARGVGTVRAVRVRGGEERLVLVSITQP